MAAWDKGAEKLQFLSENEVPAPVTRSTRLRDGFALACGRREYMEDFILVQGCFGGRPDVDLYAIFDGHGGQGAARTAASDFGKILMEQLRVVSQLDDEIVKECFEELQVECCDAHCSDEHFRVAIALHRSFGEISRCLRDSAQIGGTTALVSLFLGEDLYVANAGDTRSIMFNKQGKVSAVSVDHKPTENERKRIEQFGGTITDFSVPRVEGQLAISRALGNFDLADKGIIWNPHIRLIPNFRREHRYLIMASDGLWDTVDGFDAGRIVNEALGYKVAAWKPRSRVAVKPPTPPPADDDDDSPGYLDVEFDEEDEVQFASGRRNKLVHTHPQMCPAATAATATACNGYASPQFSHMQSATSAIAGLSVSEGQAGLYDLLLSSDEGASGSGGCCWKKLGRPEVGRMPQGAQQVDGGALSAEMESSKKLVQLAFDKHSHDNISVILVNFG